MEMKPLDETMLPVGVCVDEVSRLVGKLAAMARTAAPKLVFHEQDARFALDGDDLIVDLPSADPDYGCGPYRVSRSQIAYHGAA